MASSATQSSFVKYSVSRPSSTSLWVAYGLAAADATLAGEQVGATEVGVGTDGIESISTSIGADAAGAAGAAGAADTTDADDGVAMRILIDAGQ